MPEARYFWPMGPRRHCGRADLGHALVEQVCDALYCTMTDLSVKCSPFLTRPIIWVRSRHCSDSFSRADFFMRFF